MMRLICFSIVAISVIAIPQILLRKLNKKFWWNDERVGFVSFMLWAVSLAVLYLFVLPHLNLVPNPQFFDY
jgi:hypothetical protein